MSLPLRIKTQVRDLWTSPTSDVQKAISSLAKLLGKGVECEPDWVLIWTELKAAFPDSATFVPTIVDAITSWAHAMEEVAGDDANEDWVEKMLEGARADVRVVIAASDGKPSTRWLEREAAFEICFPKTASSHSLSSVMTAAFHADLLTAFNAEPARVLAGTGPSAPAATEAWTDVDGDFDRASIMTPASTMPLGVPRSSTVARLPSLATIPRPEDVLSGAPYFLIVRANSRKIVVEASHQAGLELMGEYLKKWVKHNHNISTKPTLVEINLRPACFGLSSLFDKLEIEVQHNDKWTTVTPMIVLSFAQTILGYELRYQEDSCWHFVRNLPFN